MPSFLLLVLASVFAAVAFFLAGYILRPPKVTVAPAKEAPSLPPQVEELVREIDTLKAQAALADQAMVAMKRRHEEEEASRQTEEKQRRALEKEQEELQRELVRREQEVKKLADRLRNAENEHKELFDRQEKTAALWQDQMDAARADRQKQEQAARTEIASLRDQLAKGQAAPPDLEALRQQLAKEQEAHSKLRTQFDQLSQREHNARRALDEARAQAQNQSGKQTAELVAERDRLTRALSAAEAEAKGAQEKAATLESTLQAKLAELATLESTLDEKRAELIKIQAAPSAPTDELNALRDSLRMAQSEIQALKEVQQDLTITLRTAGEELDQVKSKAAAATDAQHVAERRLAELDRLARENAELREANAQAAAEVEWHAEQQGEAKDAKVELAKAQAKLAELEQVLVENRRLRDEVSELGSLKESAGELEKLQVEHKQLRLDTELMARRLQEMQADQVELPIWRQQAAEAINLSEEVNYLRQREKDLEAQIYASGFYASREMPAVSGEVLIQTPVTDMEQTLSQLLGDGGPRTAILADDQGFLISGAGEHTTQEGLAAFAAVAGDMVSRTRMLLPMADVGEVKVVDRNNIVLACHLFKADDQGLGVVTLGPGEADVEATAKTIADLSYVVSGKITDSLEEGAVPDAENTEKESEV